MNNEWAPTLMMYFNSLLNAYDLIYFYYVISLNKLLINRIGGWGYCWGMNEWMGMGQWMKNYYSQKQSSDDEK